MNNDEDLVRQNARTGLIVLGVVIGMVGLAFASVPLYSLFCSVTGFGGTTQVSKQMPSEILERKITIKFNADTGRDMPWQFKPEMRSIDVHIGERGLAAFSAYNPGKEPVSGTAIYNVTPLKAGQYFNKVQCFCFDLQTLNAGERVSMPVLFFIDPKIAEDPSLDDVTTITLSYTFYKSETEELESALEGFYNE